MNGKILLVVLVVLVLGGVSFLTSKPKQPVTTPNTEQVSQNEGWQEQTVDEIGLSFSYPNDLTFRKEIGDNAGNIRTVAFYLEKGDPNNPEYQLYALYIADKESSAQDLEITKIGMDPASIRETSIDGYSGIEGIANPNDPKRHYTTIVLKDDRLFSVSTYPPMTENKELTDQIIAMFDFK